MRLRSPHSDAGDFAAGHDWRLGRFPNLMTRRVEEILLVSSAYDAFILEEDGLLTELIFSEYMDLGLTHAPRVTRVSTGEEALTAIREHRFDLVISMPRLGGMDVFAFGRAAREVRPELSIVLLIANELELHRLNQGPIGGGLDGIYV
ncbi:MAG TPA: response regulator [Phycisphaerae bacterium]|nr:response regulator [Phycisphaerae bacterium]